ncbi:MAG: LLM class flavin-dependent oxidoreductase [Actinobacteria bacterium]|nr:LLM class flavin-dependent oxidoreductase [Actinomycetota bacterium]MBV9253889.1 LLM class flavin-dependent oxidoreductase [Actinomycetota bacterium]
MKVGISLPQFRADAEAAILTARAAEAAGLDGVFVFDHLWPLGNPDRPVLQSWALLGALAVETERIDLGPLVARVGLVPQAVLHHQFETLHRMVGDRLVGGVGAGDRLSREENLAFGIDYPPVAERLTQVATACRHLREMGVRAWIGGRSAAVRELAAAEADALNVWESTPDEAREELADIRAHAGDRHVELTWGGRVYITPDGADHPHAVIKGTPDDAVEQLDEFANIGVTYAILSPLDFDEAQAAVKTLGEVASSLR